MRKLIFIIVLIAIAATGAYSQGFSMSAGGGALFDWNFDNGMEYGNNRYMVEDLMAFGGFLFFDVTYAEVEVNFTYGIRTLVTNSRGPLITESNGNFMGLGFSLLGKFPFSLGKVKLFPLLGGDYYLVLSEEKKSTNIIDVTHSASTHNQIGLLAGVGLDTIFTDQLFLRTEALFHFRLPSKFWTEVSNDKDIVSLGKTTFGMGPKIKVGLGFRFF